MSCHFTPGSLITSSTKLGKKEYVWSTMCSGCRIQTSRAMTFKSATQYDAIARNVMSPVRPGVLPATLVHLIMLVIATWFHAASGLP